MKSHFRNNTIAVAAVLLAMLIIAPACQGRTEEPESVPSIAVELGDAQAKYKWRPIREFSVRCGESIPINVGDNIALFLIPSDRFKPGQGISDWVVSKTFTAFKVEGGEATIMLDECFPASEPDLVIQYSVLARHAEDRPGEWDYVHGENPPPRMIVPPH